MVHLMEKSIFEVNHKVNVSKYWVNSSGQKKPFILNYSDKVAINFWPDGINIL